MTPLALAGEFYRTQARRDRRAANAVQALWRSADPMDLTGWFEEHADELVLAILIAQEGNAAEAQDYLEAQTAEQGVPAGGVLIDPVAFTTPVEATRAMAYSSSVLAAKTTIATGVPAAVATRWATKRLVGLASTMAADAGREATQAGMTSARMDGWVRMLQLPSCDRCVVQAGKWFEWNTGFQRHPNCDCVHVPVAKRRDAPDSAIDPVAAVRAGQVKGLSKVDRQAILDGADPSQVINAKRGMGTANVFGRDVKTTVEGTTRRGLYGGYDRATDGTLTRRVDAGFRRGRSAAGQLERYRRLQVPRLAPSECYRLAGGDQDEALRLLLRNGYLTSGLPASRAA
ncbi:hypothetical protein [Dietzia alimentaria]|uniref:VG15 protein n=1 Tax=Dietzia alimentaria TaxID=665550 RepID=UPI00029B1509|nr:hypothetical protein [Dietzia alimentaria]